MLKGRKKLTHSGHAPVCTTLHLRPRCPLRWQLLLHSKHQRRLRGLPRQRNPARQSLPRQQRHLPRQQRRQRGLPLPHALPQ